MLVAKTVSEDSCDLLGSDMTGVALDLLVVEHTWFLLETADQLLGQRRGKKVNFEREWIGPQQNLHLRNGFGARVTWESGCDYNLFKRDSRREGTF